MFDTLLQRPREQGGNSASDEMLTSEAILMLLAGMHTTSNALIVGTYGILSEPDVLQHLNRELNTAISQISSLSAITMTQLKGLPFLVIYI